jgi:HemY protein
MRRIVGIILLALIILVAVFFADRPGSVTLVWLGWRVDTSLGVLLLALCLAGLTAWLIGWLFHKIFGAPGRLIRRRRASHRLRGYRVLTDGLVAIAAGDARAAERHRRHAELLFRKGGHETPPLARLLAAQAALLDRDHAAAAGHFTAMLDHPDTEFLGLRGLIVQALKAGDDATALRLTERANQLRPRTPWVLQSQLALETRGRQWRLAQDTLRAAIRHKAVTPEQGRLYGATLLLARSRDAALDHRPRDAVTFARTAWRLDRGFAPAAVEYAARLDAAGRRPKARQVLENAWSTRPHPAIVEAYAPLLGAETPAGKLARLEKLAAAKPDEPSAHLAAAAMALSAALWGEARRHLALAGATGPGPWPRPLCRRMAELEEGEHHDAAATRLWLERAAHAPPDATYVCAACGAETPEWQPLCPSCQGFATLGWRIPDRAAPRSSAPDALLPTARDAAMALEHPPLALPEPGSVASAETATRGGGA